MESATTIAAISSPPGIAPRGVIRLSGPASGTILADCCRLGGQPLRPATRASFEVRFDDGVREQPALVLWMPGPRSFTREDVAELHLCGSPFLLHRALERLIELGAEPAAPGEFTRRAFLNGRIDLTRAEGVLALVSARNDEERRAASALLFGGLGDRMDALRDSIEGLRALCEASLDFDEADTGHVPAEELAALAGAVAEGIAEALAYEERREPSAGEARVVLAGRPNAGKSSLFNRLVGNVRVFDRALVGGEAGTTRDAKAAAWNPAGVACRLIDTAGRAEAAADLEGAAQRHAEREAGGAALVLWVVDAADPVQSPASARSEAHRALGETPFLVVWNKVDAAGTVEPPALGVSAHTGAGLDALEQAVAAALAGEPGQRRSGPGPDGPLPEPDRRVAARAGVGRELYARHRVALARAAECVEEARDGLREEAPLDLVAESLRAATFELDRIRGSTTAEDLLDRIFARFCLGK